MKTLNRSTVRVLARHLISVVLSTSFLIGAATEISAAATYYRWTDDRGSLVVSDRPPVSQDVEYEVVSQRSSLTRRVKSGEGAVPPEVVPRPGNDFDQVVATEDTEQIKKNPESCSRARINLETLESGARIRIRDETNGELRYLSEEEKVTQRRKAEDIIRVHCE